MKKLIVLIVGLGSPTVGCARKAENVTLKEGTPAYQLAKDLAAKVPSLDPAVNNVLVRAKGFEVTVAEVIQTIQDNTGNRADRAQERGRGEAEDHHRTERGPTRRKAAPPGPGAQGQSRRPPRGPR